VTLRASSQLARHVEAMKRRSPPCPQWPRCRCVEQGYLARDCGLPLVAKETHVEGFLRRRLRAVTSQY
jgi:hypothetical protein